RKFWTRVVRDESVAKEAIKGQFHLILSLDDVSLARKIRYRYFTAEKEPTLNDCVGQDDLTASTIASIRWIRARSPSTSASNTAIGRIHSRPAASTIAAST